MDIARPSSKITQSSQHILSTTDRYCTLTIAIPLPKATVMHIANIFYDQWLTSYSIQTYILTKNGTQFVSKFFAAICALLDVEHLTTTASYLQAISNAMRFNQSDLVSLRNNVEKHQKN